MSSCVVRKISIKMFAPNALACFVDLNKHIQFGKKIRDTGVWSVSEQHKFRVSTTRNIINIIGLYLFTLCFWVYIDIYQEKVQTLSFVSVDFNLCVPFFSKTRLY